MVYDKTAYAADYQAITTTFLEKFVVKGQNILGSKAFSFKEFQKSSSDVLDQLKIVFTYNYGEIFNTLINCCEYLFKLEGNEFGLGNLILLLEKMMSFSFLSESVFGKGLMN